MRNYYTYLLALVLLLTACGQGTQRYIIDQTKPVSAANRVIYQMNIGAFTPEGTFRAAMEQLGRLDSLGIDIIWLMPIYPRGVTMNSPYAVMDYKAVNPHYGNVADVKAFVSRAHELGIRVWLDWVPNHAAQENVWVQAHPDYFTRDEKGQMIHPHGWGDVLELNYQNPQLVAEMNSALAFWINECDVDGFRCDYVSSPTIPVAYWQDIIARLKSLHAGKKIEIMSETDITDRRTQHVDACGFDYDYAWSFQAQLARLCRRNFNADTLKHICQQFLDKSAKVKNRRMIYLTNHDQNYNDGGHTLRRFYGEHRYGLTVLQFTFYGMPLIYNGQEIGDPDTLNYFTDAKVKWECVDHKMLNTVRSLIALHHQQPSLGESAPVRFLETSDSQVLAWQRGGVVVAVNFGPYDARFVIPSLADGHYQQWLDSRTILDGPRVTHCKLSATEPLQLEANGYAVYVIQ